MGPSNPAERGCDIRVIASSSTWIEGEALRQLETVSRYPGMVACVGLPDLHPGRGTPIGAAFLSRDVLYPHLVGNDIGCGMALWSTDLPSRKARPDKLAARLDGLDRPMDDSGRIQRERLAEAGLGGDAALALGTPGRGNHFIELQRVREVIEPDAFASLGLDRDRLLALVHTGSRRLGETVLRRHLERHGPVGLAAGSEAARDYLAGHAAALAYADLNRRVCVERLLSAIGGHGRQVMTACHNQVSRFDAEGEVRWLHRKGAAPSEGKVAIVPGSRGDASYLVVPTPERCNALLSLAHGAGRRVARHDARRKLEGRFRRADLIRPATGGRVVCGDVQLLWEEAPECYKSAATVVEAMVEANLCRVVAILMPVVTFKTSVDDKSATARRSGLDIRKARRHARARKEGAVGRGRAQ